jgi:ribosomal protein L12E/L44/L45/RPP1/RPP2
VPGAKYVGWWLSTKGEDDFSRTFVLPSEQVPGWPNHRDGLAPFHSLTLDCRRCPHPLQHTSHAHVDVHKGSYAPGHAAHRSPHLTSASALYAQTAGSQECGLHSSKGQYDINSVTVQAWLRQLTTEPPGATAEAAAAIHLKSSSIAGAMTQTHKPLHSAAAAAAAAGTAAAAVQLPHQPCL